MRSASFWICSSRASTSEARLGTSSSAATSRASVAASIVPRARAAPIARHASTVSCAVNALVLATPISGPATVSSTTSLSRAMVLSGTFSTETTCCPACCMKRSAASVSAVSPLWLTSSPTPPTGSGGAR